MYYIFFSTSDVFKSEDILRSNNVDYEIVPTPFSKQVYCGVCIWSDEDKNRLDRFLKDLNYEVH